ncbi:cytochrome c [Verrucomicrobiales bacterium]|nr:cytochrome c [Verrucomicrobiales bacterium]
MKISIPAFAVASLFTLSVATAEDPEISTEVMTLGQQNFATCMACHGADGKGFQAGPLLMAPSMVGSKLLLADNVEIPIEILLRGITKEDMKYAGMMAPVGAILDDAKIAAVLTYARNSFGNSAPEITAEQVAKVRKEQEEETATLKRSELEAMLTEEGGAAEAPAAE